MNAVHGNRILAAAGAAVLLFAGGCASTGGAGNGGTAAAFVAPDGAHATPNTGASRLADGMPVAPAATMAVAAASPGKSPASTADGTTFTWTGGGSAVSVAGEFNNWDMAADPMVKQADGSFRLVKKLNPGRYAYKFVVDGQWKPDPGAKETVDDSFGGKNSVVVVGGGGVAAPAGAAPTPAAAAPAATGAIGKGRAPEVTAAGVRFTFGGAARTVALAGDFNAWAPAVDPLVQGADGAWTIVKKLPAGSHAYKFIVDGTTWKLDEANSASVDDGFGGRNSVVVVP